MPEVLTDPDLPDDWGLVKAACADGDHRFLPDAPRCGCGEVLNLQVELARLERDVIEAAKADLSSEIRQDGDVGIDRMIAARRAYRAAVIALMEFESSQQQKGEQWTPRN